MADNVTLPLKGQGDVTARTATEDITGTHFQKVKLIDGTAGSTTALPLSGDLTNGLDVDVTRVSGSVAVTGTFWQATQPVSLATAPSTPVTGTFWQATQPVSGTFWQTTQPVSGTVNPTTSNRSDTYSATGNGVTVDVSATPLKSFAVQVIGTGAAASLWDVRLEGSLDNVNFTQILQHTNTTGDGVVLYSGASLYPSLYFRSRCAGLTLGSATNVVVKILGT